MISFLLLLSTTTNQRSGFASGWVFSPHTATIRNANARVENLSPFPRSKPCLRQDFRDDDTGDEMEFFDDFGFVVGGDSSEQSAEEGISPSNPNQGSSSFSVLQQRFEQVALIEQGNKQQISDNWKEGYWGVWGCSLDPYTGETSEKTVVTCVRKMPPTPGEDSDNNDDGDDDAVLLIVGRSDGSLCWLQMEILSSPSSSSSSSSSSPFASDNDATSIVNGRSITTYFENKLAARATDDGGMIVGTSLQQRDDNNEGGEAGSDQSASPFELLAEIPGTASAFPSAPAPAPEDAPLAIVDVLPLPAARMLWTIAKGAPTTIRGWHLGPHPENGGLVPSGTESFEIPSIHATPIVAMKAVPNHSGSEMGLVVTVSTNGQVVVWEASPGDDATPSIRVLLDTNLLEQQWEEDDGDRDPNESVLSVDMDESYLYLGSSAGRISIFDLSGIQEPAVATSDADPVTSLPLLKSFLGFTSRNPGVSTLLAAGTGTLGARGSNAKGNRPPTKSLIAGDMTGGLKQWELIPAGRGRLEYWPRMASQKLPGGKPHVYETRDSSSFYEDDEGGSPMSPAILGLLCIQQVLLAATDHDLTVWDSATGKVLYDMQGLDFALGLASDTPHRPSLVAANDSVLVTNGMEQMVCVHDFAMDRVTSENAENFLERDPNDMDDDDGSNPGEGW